MPQKKQECKRLNNRVAKLKQPQQNEALRSFRKTLSPMQQLLCHTRIPAFYPRATAMNSPWRQSAELPWTSSGWSIALLRDGEHWVPHRITTNSNDCTLLYHCATNDFGALTAPYCTTSPQMALNSWTRAKKHADSLKFPMKLMQQQRRRPPQSQGVARSLTSASQRLAVSHSQIPAPSPIENSRHSLCMQGVGAREVGESLLPWRGCHHCRCHRCGIGILLHFHSLMWDMGCLWGTTVLQ